MTHQLLTIDEVVLAKDLAQSVRTCSRTRVRLVQSRFVIVPVAG